MSAKNIVMAAAGVSTGGIQYVGGYATSVGPSLNDVTITFGGNLTGGLSSSASAGDLVVVYFGVSSPGDLNLVIAGYTEVVDIFANNTRSSNLAVGYKFMGVSPDTTVTLTSGTQSSGNGGAIAIHVWRGVDTVLPLDVAATTATDTASASANPPSITPSAAGAVILAGGVGAHVQGTQVFSSSDLSGFVTSGSANTTNDATIGLGYKTWTGGAFDPAAFTGVPASPTPSSAAVTLALRPNQNQPGPIAISQASTQNTTSGASLVINKPTGTREGDLMVAFIASGGGTQAAPGWSGDTGWTYVANLTTNGRPVNAIAYKVAGASEGASYTFTSTNNRTATGTIVTYRNAAYDVIGSATNGTNPLVLPEVTLSADYSYLIGFAGRDLASVTVTAPAGMSTLKLDADATAPSYLIAHEGPEPAGATGTRSFTTGNSTNSNGLMAGVKPAASYTKYAQYITSTSATGSGVNSLAVNTPACVPGNLLLFVVTVGTSTATSLTVSTPSGWTLLAGNSTDTTAYQPGMYVFYRVVDGSEAASYTATPSSTAAMCGSIVSLAGVDVSTLTAGTTGTGSATTSITATGVTATANGILLYLGCQANSNQGPVTFTPPSGMTEAVDVAQDGGGIDSTLEIAYQEGLTEGATGSKTATASANAGTNRYRAILVTVGAK